MQGLLISQGSIKSEAQLPTERVIGDGKSAACLLSTAIPAEAAEYHRARLPWTGVYRVQG